MTRRLTQLIAAILVVAGAASATADDEAASSAMDTLVSQARAVLTLRQANKDSEKTLEQIVLTLATETPTPAARALVEELSGRPPQVLVAHEEGGAMIPFVDVGAAARFTLRHWTRNVAHKQALHATRAGDARFLPDYFSSDAARQAGIVDAVRDAKGSDLVFYRDGLLNRIAEPGGDRLAVVFAEKLADTTLYERVIVGGSASIALDAVKTLERALGADAALGLMRLGLNRSDIASATLYEVGNLRSSLPAAGLLLWEMLGDPGLGGTAAAVLARDADSETVETLIGVLQDSDSVLLQKRAALALRLSGDARAQQVANQWLASQPDGVR